MIIYVKLKNFKSFGEIEFDFRKTMKKTKKFVAIYGENGSGKTNFIESIRLLVINIVAYRNYCNLPQLKKNISENFELNIENSFEYIKNLMQQVQGCDFNAELSNSRMKECSEPTELEYGFRYTGSDGLEHDAVYKISFTDRIISENLRCWTGKQNGNMFSINGDKSGNIGCKFNSNMIKNRFLYSEIHETIQQFWGKFSLLSILFNVVSSKNKKYSEDNLSVHLTDFLHEIKSINVVIKGISTQMYYQSGSSGMLLKLDSGSISENEFENLIRSEKILCQILTQTYSDIKFAEYEIIRSDDGYIKYKLILDKMIAGKVRRIAIDEESFGTIRLLEVLAPLVSSLNGMTVFIDEIDTGIHDLLCRNIIDSVRKNITGQLIITTHNTALLKYIDPYEAYIIDVDYEGNKEAICISDFGLQKTHNLCDMYMSGKLGGVPVMDYVDTDAVVEIMSTI
ncbi:MAG: AAA family ATPase [Ruminococcus sp.]|nr:AAA family ATPase [Ruminococcus sp.]